MRRGRSLVWLPIVSLLGTRQFARLLAALVVLVVAFAPSTSVAEAQNGVAVINLKSGPAVEAAGDIAAGHVGSEGLLFDDGVLGCCVAPSGARARPGTVQPGVERTYDMALNPQEFIDTTVKQYGINLRGSGQRIDAVYNPDLASAGMSRAATPNVIEIGPLGMSSSDELARTLSHELNHARSWLAGGAAPESTAYAAEDALSAWLAGQR